MLILTNPFTWASVCVGVVILIILSKHLPPPSHGAPV